MTESLVTRFLKGTLSVGFGNALGLILGFVGTAVAVRLVTPEEFGAFVMLQVAFIFLTEMSGFGLPMAMAQFVSGSEDDEHKWRVINTALHARLLAIAATCLLIFFAEGSLIAALGWLFDPAIASVVVYLPVLFALESLGKFFKSTLQCLFQFRMIGVIAILIGVFNLTFTIILMVYMELGLTGLIYAKIGSLLLAYLVAYLSARIQHRLVFDLGLLQQMLRLGMPLQGTYLLSFVHGRLDTLMIGAMMGPSQIAFFEVARRIPEGLMGLCEAFHAVYFPFIARLFAQGERETATQALNNSVRWMSFLTIFGALFALLFGREIVLVLFSETYLPSVPAFVILMVALNLGLVEQTLGYSQVALGDSASPFIINVVRSVASLGGNLLLIPVFGFVGAALVSVMANLAVIPLNMFFLWKRQVHAQFSPYLTPLLIFGACGLLDAGGLLLIEATPLVYAFKVVLVLLFLVTCVMLSVVKREDAAVFTSMPGLRQRFGRTASEQPQVQPTPTVQ